MSITIDFKTPETGSQLDTETLTTDYGDVWFGQADVTIRDGVVSHLWDMGDQATVDMFWDFDVSQITFLWRADQEYGAQTRDVDGLLLDRFRVYPVERGRTYASTFEHDGMRSLHVGDFEYRSYLEQVRLTPAVVPEPSGLLLVLLAVVLLWRRVR